MPQRLVIILGAAAVGALFLSGLFVHGRPGGALLVVTDVILIGLARATWTHIRSQGRPLRIAVVVVIAVVAALKLIKG